MPLSNVPVPEGLDDPPHLLFWSFDVVSIFSIFTIIGALFDHPLVGAVAGVVAGALFERYVKPLSTLVCWAHWTFGVAPFRRIPASHKRFFIG